MYNSEIISLFNAALAGVIRAKEIILDYYQTDLEVDYKGDNTPVTMADKMADMAIREALTETNIPMISEEFEVPSYDERKDYSRYWLIDPLDGTKDFVRQNGEFTINIALIDDGQVVAGLICVPVTDEVYFGGKRYPSIKYQGPMLTLTMEEMLLNAIKLPAVKNKKPILIASRTGDVKQLEKLAHQHLKTENFTIQRIGSSLKLCWLAEGKVDMYPRLSPCMEWDIAAGQAIVEGAGKQVLNYHDQKPISYNKESLLSSWFIAK